MNAERGNRHPLATMALAGLAATACGVGDGSDIGPKLPALPAASCKVVVLDDEGRGVVGATVRAGGASALTGRNGRGDLLAEPRGRLPVTVDARDGAAANGDVLPAFQVATTIVGPDLPAVLHVPVLDASATLASGTQAAATAISSPGGGSLTIAAGDSVGIGSGAASALVRVGDLQPQHLPGDLPVAATGALLFTPGVWIDADGVSFTPPARLSVADSLGAGTGPVRAFRFDPAGGEWSEVAPGNAAAGRITSDNAVTGGGLYAFAVAVTATSVSGRVVDAAGVTLPDVMLRIDQVTALSDRNGIFSAAGVPAALANGSSRVATVEWFAGGDWLPARGAAAIAVAAPATDTGDLVLDTMLGGNVRVQQVASGRQQAFAPARFGSLRGDVALVTSTDAKGQTLFEDVPADFFGFQEGFAVDGSFVFYGQSIGVLARGRRWLDASQFLQRRPWYVGGRRSRTYVSDTLGGGPVFDAALIQGDLPGQGYAGSTGEGGSLFITRDFAGRATASARSERDGKVVVSAFSIVRPNGDHLELPLQRVRRQALAAFDRHGLVAGSLLGADATAGHELLAGRRLSVQEWWDERIDGAASAAVLPLDVDPAVTHAAFVTGVPAAGGNVAAIEFTTPAGRRTLQKAGVLADVVPPEGGRLAADLALTPIAGSTFVVPGLLATAEPELDVSRLQLNVALQQPSGTVIEVARGLQGNHAAAGQDLAFALPPLSGPFAGLRWLALLDGSYASLGTTVRCSSLVSLPRTGDSQPPIPLGAPAFGAFPDLQAPTPGASVAAAGFTVQFTLPPGALHGALELRSELAGDTRCWQVVVPPDATSFAFVTLPAEAVTPLIANRTWTLRVTAFFGDGAVRGAPDPYRELATFLQSIGPIERGAATATSRTIQITTN